MNSNIDLSIPIVVIYNNLETFYEFLNRTDDVSIIEKRRYRGDRALLWLGERKLVFAGAQVQHLEYLQQQLGYKDTVLVSPETPSPWLSLDILRETALLNRLIEYAGPSRTLQIVPYATTSQLLHLVDVLRQEYGLTVLLPESPSPEAVWLRDYMDTKAGFRVLCEQWLRYAPVCLPEGITCESIKQAADAALWFLRQGRNCIIKADKGEGSLGHHILYANQPRKLEDIVEELHGIALLRNDILVVEEYIQSSRALSPSLEFFVPPIGAGEPAMTYPANQIFLDSGAFDGVLISKTLEDESWYLQMYETGMLLARKLQQAGYTGPFDLDAVVDDDDCVFLLEANMRRTGGTHTHEFAVKTFGPDYLDYITLLSHNKLESTHLTSFDDLRSTIDELLFPMDGENKGVVIAVTSAISQGQFGCMIAASSFEEAKEIHAQLIAKLRTTTPVE